MSNQLQVSGAAKIRTIQGPVVANSGVITALDGDASQYVRGDGTLADFPTSTGGGSSVSYYLNTSVSQGTIGGVAYKQLSKVPISGAGTDVTTSANGYIASYITDANDPALLEVPAGNFNCEFYFSVNSNAHNPYVYAEVYKYDGTTFTLLGSNVSIPQYLSNGTTLSPYYFAIAVSTAVLTVTDRIAIRIYVNVDTRTVTLHTENNHLCQVVTTFSKGLISLNNLTRQNQFFATGTSGTDFGISSATATHTFNLPVASAANTGKLSSTDWSTFNGKVPYTGATADVNLGTYQIISNGGDFRAQGANNPIGLILSSDYVVISNPKTIYTSYGQSAILGGHEFRSVNGSGTGLITSFYLNPSGAAIFYYSVTANSFIKSGGTSSQFLKADGSVDSSSYITLTSLSFVAGSGAYNNTTGVITIPTNNNQITNGAGYITSSALSSYVPYTGATSSLEMGIGSFGIQAGKFILFNRAGSNTLGVGAYQGFVDAAQSNGVYLQLNASNNLAIFGRISGADTLVGFISTSGSFNGTSFVKTGGTSSQFLKADGSVDSSSYLPLTGGSLTGNLFGTGASFSGGITSNGGINLNGYTNSAGANYVEIGTTSTSYIIAAINRTTGNYNYPLYIDAQKIIINSTSLGSVGIGTSSPNIIGFTGPMLTIAGTGQGQGIEIWRNSNTIPDGEDLGLITFLAGTSPLQVARIVGKAVGTSEDAGALSFQTSASGGGVTERMKISSAGIITTPNQVSFKAYFTGGNPSLTKGVLSTMPYNAEEYDVQSNFNTGTYKFTAPVAGKYLFTVNVNVYGLDDTASFRILLTINSSSNRYLFWIQNMATGNTGDCNFSGSDILNLASGATVEVRVFTDGSGTFNLSGGLDYNSFSGHLL